MFKIPELSFKEQEHVIKAQVHVIKEHVIRVGYLAEGYLEVGCRRERLDVSGL